MRWSRAFLRILFVKMPILSVRGMSFRRKCPTLGRALCPSFFCFHRHTGFVRCLLTSFCAASLGAASASDTPGAGKALPLCGLALSRTRSGFWTGDMKNLFPGTAGEGRVRATHRGYFNPSTRQAMLSSEFWPDFLPAGKDFTIPAPNFLPAGIPFLEVANLG
jgi:hypothetical protein